MRRAFGLFLIFGAGIFTLSFFTAKTEISMIQRLGYTVVLALVPSVLLVCGSNRTTEIKNISRGFHSENNLEIHFPLDPKVLYRIKNQKIYKGMDVAPVYEMKGNKIYPHLSSKPAFRIEKNKVYRGVEVVPFLEIKGDKIYHSLSGKIAYEIKDLR